MPGDQGRLEHEDESRLTGGENFNLKKKKLGKVVADRRTVRIILQVEDRLTARLQDIGGSRTVHHAAIPGRANPSIPFWSSQNLSHLLPPWWRAAQWGPKIKNHVVPRNGTSTCCPAHGTQARERNSCLT